MGFIDRIDAGKKLAKALKKYKGAPDVVVVALPRGGVPVGRIVADTFGCPLDIVVPRKIGAQENEEYAIGALTEAGDVVWNESERMKADPAYLKSAVKDEKAEAKRRMELYRQDMPARDLKDKTVIIVDDGIATGLTMVAAVRTVRAESASHIVVAVPVAPADNLAWATDASDDVVALEIPHMFTSIGAFYRTFDQTTDEEVIDLLHG